MPCQCVMLLRQRATHPVCYIKHNVPPPIRANKVQPSGQTDQILAHMQWRAVSRCPKHKCVRTLGGPYFHAWFFPGFLNPSAPFRNRGVGCAEEGVRHRLDKKQGYMMKRLWQARMTPRPTATPEFICTLKLTFHISELLLFLSRVA